MENRSGEVFSAAGSSDLNSTSPRPAHHSDRCFGEDPQLLSSDSPLENGDSEAGPPDFVKTWRGCDLKMSL